MDMQASGCDELLDSARNAASNDLFATQRRARDSMTVVDHVPGGVSQASKRCVTLGES